jgi:hypothetical protein
MKHYWRFTWITYQGEITGASCFSSITWVRAVAVARNKRHWPLALQAQGEDGTTCYLLGAWHWRYGIPVFEAMPMGGYSDWSSIKGYRLPPIPTQEWLRHIWLPVVIISTIPTFEENINKYPNKSIWLRQTLLETHILDLQPSPQILLAQVKSSVRSYFRRIDQLGFSFNSGGIELLESFMKQYILGRGNWQKQPTSNYSIDFFRTLLSEERAEIWNVERDNEVVGSAFFLKGSDDVMYFASGVQKVTGPVSPMDALIWTAILDFQQRGYKTFNMGASRGLDSVRRFKEKFGARRCTYIQTIYILPRLVGLWLKLSNWLKQ